jgi:hypothetical protein
MALLRISVIPTSLMVMVMVEWRVHLGVDEFHVHERECHNHIQIHDANLV